MPDTDLEVGGGAVIQTRQSPKKKFFDPSGLTLVLKVSREGGGGGGAGRAPPLDLPLIREGYLIKTEHRREGVY